MLRLGKEFTKDERINRVDEVLNFVGTVFSPGDGHRLLSSLLAQFNQVREHHHWYSGHCQRSVRRREASLNVRD